MSERSPDTDIAPPAAEGADGAPPGRAGPRGLLRRDGATDTRAKRGTIVAACVLALLGIGFLITRSPVFSARHVEVTGASHLSRADVLRLARVGHGTNVFWLHTGPIERRLERDPWIASATVSRSLPSTISIGVVERVPVGEVQRAAGGYAIVAADGTVLGRTRAPGTYPTLLVDPSSRAALVSAARVAGGMDPWLLRRVRAIDARSGSLVIRLVSGIPAYYGDTSDIAAKDHALAAVLRWALDGSQPVQSIDLRAPLAPTAQLPYTPPPSPVPSPSPSPSPSGSASPKASPSASPAATKPARTHHHPRRKHGG